MKYKDTKPDDDYQHDFYWYITDESAHEFATCENCQVEAPLSNFSGSFISGEEWLCQICSHTTIRRDSQQIAQAANMILLILGAFNDVDVLMARDHIAGYQDD